MPIKSNFSRHCIFRSCDDKFKDWKERTDHIADHLKDPWDMSQWRDPDETEDSESSGSDASESDDSESDADSSDDSEGSDDGGSAPPNAGNEQDTDPRDPDPRSSGPRKGRGSHNVHRHGTPGGFSFHTYGLYTSHPFDMLSAGPPPSYLSLHARKIPRYSSQNGSKSKVIIDDVSTNRMRTIARKRIRRDDSERQHTHDRATPITPFMQPVAVCNIWQYMNACQEGNRQGT